MATVAKMRFVGSDSQVYYDNFTIGYLQIFKQGTSFHRSIAIMTNETTNYNFILPSKTCQRHLETRAVILSKAITHFIKPWLSLFFFHGQHSSYINIGQLTKVRI